MFLPKGAPKAIVDKLNEATHAAMDTPAIKSRMPEIGVIGIAPERRSPEYLAKFVVEEVARWEGADQGRRAAGRLAISPLPRPELSHKGRGKP